MFLSNVEFAQDYLYPISKKFKNLRLYKEFEGSNFSDIKTPLTLYD
jgi:hypothetical protein